MELDQTERDELAQMNLSASRKARVSTAYQLTYEYAEIGLNLLGSHAWQRQYKMTLTLHELAAESASLCGEFDLMNQWIDAVIDHAETALDQVNVYIVKIQVLASHHHFLEAISTGLSILKKLAVEFPEHPNPAHIQEKIQEINQLIDDAYWCGQPLLELELLFRDYHQQMWKLNQFTIANFCLIYWQTTIFLLGNPDNIDLLFQETTDEEELDAELFVSNPAKGYIFYLYRAVLRFLVGDFTLALADMTKLRQDFFPESSTGAICESIFCFYDSLIVLATVTDITIESEIQQRVQQNQSLLQHWAEYAPKNYLHKWQLVEAEKCRVLGLKAEAIDLYDEAIAGAKDNGYIQVAALANELTAKFYLSRGKELIGRAYMHEAYYYYQLWGAIIKVQDLETKYAQLLTTFIPILTNTKNTSTFRSTSSSTNNNLDIDTVMKASQAIAGEIVLDKLLASLMQIMIESTGAQRGYLILSTQGKLLIEAASEELRDHLTGKINSHQITVLQSLPVENCQFLSEAIINYVVITQESVILNDAAREGKFVNNIYVKQNQPKSILCVPLINQGKLISIVYLENNLTIATFTPDRVAILKVLSSQAAISIENAKLYNELFQLNQAYQRFVPRQFLEFLNKSSIIDVKLGDQVQLEMSVLFSDIRDFTALSETMTPEHNFKFINSYLSRMEPVITENHGFIDKYIGDAIMALFSGEVDNAVKAGISMLHHIAEYNRHRANSGYSSIRIGIGINTGSLMMGTVGGQNRMDSTVISDAVNLASRLEDLTKNYGVSLLISQETYSRLQHPTDYAIRIIDTVQVKGKSQMVTVYEVFDADPPEIKAGKLATLSTFAEALKFYDEGDVSQAARLFAACWHANGGNRVAQIYFERCQFR